MIIKKNLVKYTNCRVDNDKLKVQSKQLLEEGSDDISNLRHSKKLTRNFAHREFHNKIQWSMRNKLFRVKEKCVADKNGPFDFNENKVLFYIEVWEQSTFLSLSGLILTTPTNSKKTKTKQVHWIN